METHEERDPKQRGRRLRWASVVAVGATGLIAGVVLVARSPQAGAKVAEYAASSNRLLRRPVTGAVMHVASSASSTEPTELIEKGVGVVDQVVQAHTKMQAIGPKWSEHRLITIGSYLRTAPASA